MSRKAAIELGSLSDPVEDSDTGARLNNNNLQEPSKHILLLLAMNDRKARVPVLRAQ